MPFLLCGRTLRTAPVDERHVDLPDKVLPFFPRVFRRGRTQGLRLVQIADRLSAAALSIPPSTRSARSPSDTDRKLFRRRHTSFSFTPPQTRLILLQQCESFLRLLS